MNCSEIELKKAVKKALAMMIASLPFPKDPSTDLTEAWTLVLADEGVQAYQVEAAMVDALKLEAFPPPMVFARICHKHRKPFLLTESACLPINTQAPELGVRSTDQIREDVKQARLRVEKREDTPDELAQAEEHRRLLREQIERRKAASS